MKTSGGAFGRADLTEAIKEEALDLWICHHFRVLPTSKEFKKLTEYQKVFLLQGYLEQPTSEEIRHSYLSETRSLVTDEDEAAFREVGFTAEQIKRMKKQLAEAGMM